MSVQWIGWVLDHAEATGGQRLVLIALANHANEDGIAFPGLDTIAHEARLSRRSTEEAIRRLIDADYVTREVNAAPMEMLRHGRTDRRPNLYRLLRGGVEDPATPQAERGGRSCTNGVEDRRVNGVEASSTRTISKEPSVEPSFALPGFEPNGTNGNESAAQRAERRFSLFWDAYPRRNGKRLERREAHDVWMRMTPAEHEAAWRAVHHYAAGCGDMPKNAHRWLRHRLWEDWQTPAEGDGREPYMATRGPEAFPPGGAA